MTAVMFQNMPPLSPEEYAALETSIRENGIQVPILVDEDDVVVDGHHRRKIAQELGIECPTNTVRGKSDADKRTLALSLNLDRRHLNREQRRALVAESIKADPQLSNREHARRLGASDMTVGSVRRDLEESAQIMHFSERLDPRTGNPSQAASRPSPSFNPSPEDIAEQEADEEIKVDTTTTYDRETGEVVDELCHEDPQRVTRMHGESYARPEPSGHKPKAEAITRQFRSIVVELDRVMNRLHRVTTDKNFPNNREKVATLHRSDLQRAVDELQTIIDEIN